MWTRQPAEDNRLALSLARAEKIRRICFRYFSRSSPPLKAVIAACCIGELTEEKVSLATVAIAFLSADNCGGNTNVPSRHPPAAHHFDNPEQTIVPSG